LYSRGEFKKQSGEVKPKAFMPTVADNEVSVFRTIGLSEDVVWWLAAKYVTPSGGKPVLGRADLAARVALEPPLTVLPCEPGPRHAAIRGRERSDLLALAQDLSLRQKLSDAANLVVAVTSP
jgi:uncharacterized protein YbjT (DUF2867 family)